MRGAMAYTNEQLRSASLFAELPDESLERVRETVAEFDAVEGSVLVQPGAEGSGLFIICDGTVAVDTRGVGTIELGPGECIGELSLLTPATRSARVWAKTPVHGLAIGRHDFAELLKREPTIAIAMLGVLARRLIDTSARHPM
jgi:CRP/FNR family transcriptional regulator, cyclic AMP receptor protein